MQQSNSLYEKRLTQLHDTGIVQRMVEVSGDPSAMLPPSIDVGYPASPVMDISRYAQRTFIIHENQVVTGGATSGTVVLATPDLLTELNKARAFKLESISWTDAYSGVPWDGWVEFFIGLNLNNGTYVRIPLLAYYATLLGGARDVIILPDNRLNTAIIDKPIYVDRAPAVAEQGEGAVVDGVLFTFERLGGGGTPSFENVNVIFTLYY